MDFRNITAMVGLAVAGTVFGLDAELLKASDSEEVRQFVVYKEPNPLGGKLVRIVECDKSVANHTDEFKVLSSKECNRENSQGFTWSVPFPEIYSHRLKHFLGVKNKEAIRSELKITQAKKDAILAEIIDEAADGEKYGTDLFDPSQLNESIAKLDRKLEALNADLNAENKKEQLVARIMESIERSTTERVLLPGSTGVAMYAPFAYESEFLIHQNLGADFKAGKVAISKLLHTDTVRHAAFSADEKFTASASGREVKLWDVEANELLLTFQHSDPVQKVFFVGGGGKKLVSLDSKNLVHLWEIPEKLNEFPQAILTKSKHTYSAPQADKVSVSLAVAEGGPTTESPRELVWLAAGKKLIRLDFTKENPAVQTIEPGPADLTLVHVGVGGSYLLTNYGWLNLDVAEGEHKFSNEKANPKGFYAVEKLGKKGVETEAESLAENESSPSYYFRVGKLSWFNSTLFLQNQFGNEPLFDGKANVAFPIAGTSPPSNVLKWGPSGIRFLAVFKDGELAVVRLGSRPQLKEGNQFPKLRK